MTEEIIVINEDGKESAYRINESVKKAIEEIRESRLAEIVTAMWINDPAIVPTDIEVTPEAQRKLEHYFRETIPAYIVKKEGEKISGVPATGEYRLIDLDILRKPVIKKILV